MNELRFLLKDENLNQINWIRFFNANSALIKSCSLKEKEQFLRQYIEEIGASFTFATENCNISLDFLRQWFDEFLNSDRCYVIHKLYVKEFIDRVQDWTKMVPILVNLDQKLLERYREEIDWGTLLEQKQFSIQFINRNLSYFLWLNKKDRKLRIWNTLSYFQQLDDDFIEKYKNKLDWELMSVNQQFSEKIMFKYMNIIRWNAVLDNKNIIIPYSIEKELREKNIL